jgi:DNA-directed RNA polymerase subunit RPC12/RpoP
MWQFLVALVIVIALNRAWNNRPQARMRRAVELDEAESVKCPHCHETGYALPASAAGNAAKVLGFGIFSLGSLRKYRCTNCGYKW